ncbi:hypothetical protein T492DRAFT_837538 [Pavlovales sp. CCMP2436]|nr:hypothetical protein T492DRAFT_837538 [Pavlovales sp. CCMP2436]
MVSCAALTTLATLVLVGVLITGPNGSPLDAVGVKTIATLPDWPCDTPDPSTILNTQPPFVNVPLASCSPFTRFSLDSRFSYVDVANAWMAAGLNMDLCPAAVVISGVEFRPVADRRVRVAPVAQVGPDWATRVLNPCENARYNYAYIVTPAESYDKGCFTGEGGKITAPQRVEPCTSKDTCPKDQPASVDGWDFEYSKGHCNWLGPFCHWQVNRNFNLKAQGNVCSDPWCSCCAWTGGANENQPMGFPDYYQKKFMHRIAGVNPGPAYPAESYAKAQAICAQATGVPVAKRPLSGQGGLHAPDRVLLPAINSSAQSLQPPG